MLDAMKRRKQTIKEDQQLSTMPHPGRIPTHRGSGTSSGSTEAHHYNYKQQQRLPRLPGAPLAPLSSDMATEASAASAGDGSASSSSWVKPGCMMELARLAKIPQPASGLMCPRCRSNETKFCYYNNYSLSQPRHFCKTCRRYWTHGGALRDLPFSSSVRRRRGRNKSANDKHTSSKLACCGASGTGRASSSSSSGGATVPAATAVVQLLEHLIGGVECHRTGASRLWFPGHSSQDPIPLGYHHQLGNSIKLQHQCYLPQRQPFSFLGYRNGAGAAGTSAICPSSAGAGSAEAAGQMGLAALTITELSSEMMVENPPTIPSTEMMGTTLTTTTSPGDFHVGLQGEIDLFHFLGSGGGGSCTAAPGNAWPDGSGFTSSSSGRSTIL